MLTALAEPLPARSSDAAPPCPTALILTVEEARRAVDLPDDVRFMTLSPRAYAALDPELRDRVVREPFGDFGHARIAARAHRAHEAFFATLEAQGTVRDGTAHGLDFTFLNHAYVVARIWETLQGPGPWYQPTGDGWKKLTTREEAHVSLVEHLCPFELSENPPPAAPLYRLLRRAVLGILRRRGRWVVTREPNLMFGLEAALERQDRRYRRLVLRLKASGLRDYQLLWRGLLDGLGDKPFVAIPLAPRNDDRNRSAVQAAIAAISDPVIKRGLIPALKESLILHAASSEGLYRDAARVLRQVKADCYVTRQDSGRFASVAEAAGSLGVPRLAINYNTFPVTGSAIARKVLHALFRVRMAERLSDLYLMWSPHMNATGREVFPQARVSALQPLRVPKSAVRDPGVADRGRTRRVLYASNYSEYYYFVPWIMETSNEFIEDIATAAERLAALDDVDLTIRTKPKGECRPETIRHFVGEGERLHITGTEQPFREVLDEVDLLISFSSTTIELALLHRTPVLLWGRVARYRHLPAQTTPPTPENRAAVYAVGEAADLAPMVAAILDAHAGRPLTDAEISGHVWSDETPDIDAIALDWAARTAAR